MPHGKKIRKASVHYYMQDENGSTNISQNDLAKISSRK